MGNYIIGIRLCSAKLNVFTNKTNFLTLFYVIIRLEDGRKAVELSCFSQLFSYI